MKKEPHPLINQKGLSFENERASFFLTRSLVFVYTFYFLFFSKCFMACYTRLSFVTNKTVSCLNTAIPRNICLVTVLPLDLRVESRYRQIASVPFSRHIFMQIPKYRSKKGRIP